MAEMCETARGFRLYDSDTNDVLECEDDCDALVGYVEAICMSLDCSPSEGHVAHDGRRVYAQTMIRIQRAELSR